MFKTKKTQLFVPQSAGTVGKTSGIANAFVNQGMKTSAETKSGNGALKYSTTGNALVDQLGSTGQYLEPRNYVDISRDMSELFSEDKLNAVKFILYLRLISRQCVLPDGSKTEAVQKGVGLKHEAQMRMIWLFNEDPVYFWNNIQLFISCGSWKDIFDMMRLDLEYHGFNGKVLDWKALSSLIAAGLENEDTTHLVRKYLPRITAKSKCTTMRLQCNTVIGKYLMVQLFGEGHYKKYRLLKSKGLAHRWQQLISQQLYNEINFDSIHGRALMGIVNSKFLKNHNLEGKYTNWIESQPIAKFTGYVHELAMTLTKSNYSHSLSNYQRLTINKQYEGLVELAKKDTNVNSGLIVVRDTSGSMTSQAKGINMSSYNVAKALGIFFGDMLEGHFSNSWIEFNSSAKMHTYKQDNFVDKWYGERSSYIGSTNFLSVIRLFGSIKGKGVSESEFPTGILCISDGEFNSGQLGKSNVDSAKSMLRSYGFSEEYISNFQIILWNIPNSYYSDTSTKFETFGNVENVFYLSGYDGSIVSFLLGGKDQAPAKTTVDVVKNALDQEILNLVKI